MPITRTQSIASRLTMMNMLVSGVALLLACAGFFAYDQITFRNTLVRTLSAQAQIIGSNSVSAILFNDPQAAAATLSALKTSHNIASAGIFNADRRPLAQYSREAGDEALNIPLPTGEQTEAHWFRASHLVLVRQILSDGKTVGFVYLRADLRELDQRLKRYALISISVLVLSLLAAISVSSAFRKSVAQPIIHLADVAQRISRERDYTTRFAPLRRHDEIAVLIESFNQMLAELHSAHEELEQRVQERTRDLVSANRELEAFSYSVSHDLRGPLEALNGFTYVLAMQYEKQLDAQGRDLIEHIRNSSRRMNQLINDLLNLSKMSTQAIHREKVDLSAMARSIAGELQRNSPERKVEFAIAPTPEVDADPRLLQLVMDNLLRNAWKYTSRHESARIVFGQRERRGLAAYFVQDDGSGFDPSSADRLFQPFQRLHSSTDFPGEGIGLATVRRIIERHGGQVWAEAEVEKGATFYFTLK